MYNLLIQHKQYITDSNMKILNQIWANSLIRLNAPFSSNWLLSEELLHIIRVLDTGWKLVKKSICPCVEVNTMIWRPIASHIHNFSIRCWAIICFKPWTLYFSVQGSDENLLVPIPGNILMNTNRDISIIWRWHWKSESSQVLEHVTGSAALHATCLSTKLLKSYFWKAVSAHHNTLTTCFEQYGNHQGLKIAVWWN
jgi:hypothetical protein